MSLSKKHLAENDEPVLFDPDILAEALKRKLPAVDFCFLMGSAADGTVSPHSDLDLAFHLTEPASLQFYRLAMNVVERIAPSVRADIGILNTADPIYRFEALKGKLLFVREQERYLTFYSRTCREYESQMFDYERQLRYRKEGHAI